MIHWIDDYKTKKKTPFDTDKDAVIIGRGKLNRDRYLFNLEKVNLFFLHHKPPKWAVDYYRRQYPESYKNSMFIFMHGAHLNDLLSVSKFGSFPVISWPGEKLPGIKTNNVSCAATDFLGQVLRGKNIYISAFDFTDDRQWVFQKNGDGRDWTRQGRIWKQEAIYLSQTFSRNADNNYRFITFNQYFVDSPHGKNHADLAKSLTEAGVIKYHFTDGGIDASYFLSGTGIEPEPGELLRTKYPK